MMSRFLKFTAFGVRQEQGRGVHPDRSDSGVDVTVRGWKQGLNKVRLTQTLRDGGMGLDAALRTTGAILDGREVRVHLSPFDSITATKKALLTIQVAEVDRKSVVCGTSVSVRVALGGRRVCKTKQHDKARLRPGSASTMTE